MKRYFFDNSINKMLMLLLMLVASASSASERFIAPNWNFPCGNMV
jgi:hypothetical protein